MFSKTKWEKMTKKYYVNIVVEFRNYTKVENKQVPLRENLPSDLLKKYFAVNLLIGSDVFGHMWKYIVMILHFHYFYNKSAIVFLPSSPAFISSLIEQQYSLKVCLHSAGEKVRIQNQEGG